VLEITSNGAVIPEGNADDIAVAAAEVAAADIEGDDLLTTQN
jgi:hypothetical protein